MNDEMKIAISNLRQPENIMSFFDSFFDYGCIDVDGMAARAKMFSAGACVTRLYY